MFLIFSCPTFHSSQIYTFCTYRGADKSLARIDWKNNWKVEIFRQTRRSLLPHRPGWTDKFLIFFWVACKSYSLVIVNCFLPGRAKDLSAPRYFKVRLVYGLFAQDPQTWSPFSFSWSIQR